MRVPEATGPEVLHALQRGEGVLIDVRELWEHEEQSIEGSRLIPLGELQERLDEVPADVDVYVHCRMGGRSARAVEFLQVNGRPRASNLLGGIEAWIDAGLPVQERRTA